ncbi:MAG: polysaccharide biosynthesis PFTS motif protein [Rhodospirillales bacterium]|nr:polysaccharide biosynthesis PFTS motif protein [Rhodospirillales bacterium]
MSLFKLKQRACTWFAVRARQSHFKKLRRRVEAWNALQERHDLNSNMELLRKICQVDLGLPKSAGAMMVPAADLEHLDLALRQIVMRSTIYSSFLPVLMCHSNRPEEKIAQPLPPAWRQAMEREGVNFDYFWSRFNWLQYQLEFFFFGLKRATQLLRDCRRLPSAPEKGYALLMNMPLSGVPSQLGAEGEDAKFVSWYSKSKLHQREDSELIWVHIPGAQGESRGDNLQIVSRPVPKFESTVQVLKFALEATRLTLIAAGGGLIGRWWTSVLFEDAVQAAYFRILGKDKLAKSYVFVNSDWGRRPLWTHFAERNKSRIIMACYSANMEPNRWRDGSATPVDPGIQLTSWPTIAVWDNEQAEFLHNAVEHREIDTEVVGPIPLGDSGAPLPSVPKNSVAVFDVSIYRPVWNAWKGLLAPYYSFETVSRFLIEAHQAITASGCTMVIKSKRNIGTNADRRYTDLVEQLSKEDNVLVVDPDLNAERLVKEVDAVIAISYSSTAILGQYAGKTTTYFDPLGSLKTNNGWKHGVPVCETVEELTTCLRDRT